MIDVTVRTVTGAVIPLANLSGSDTIATVKQHLSHLLRIPASCLHLMFSHRELVSGCLHDHSITTGATLTVIPTLASGPPRPAGFPRATAAFSSSSSSTSSSTSPSTSLSSPFPTMAPPPLLDPSHVTTILKTLSKDQLDCLQVQRRPLRVTAKIGDQLVAFILLPPLLLSSSSSHHQAIACPSSSTAAMATSLPDREGVLLGTPFLEGHVRSVSSVASSSNPDGEQHGARWHSSLSSPLQSSSLSSSSSSSSAAYSPKFGSSFSSSSSLSSKGKKSLEISSHWSSSSSSSSPSFRGSVEQRRRRELRRQARAEARLRVSETTRVKVGYLLGLFRRDREAKGAACGDADDVTTGALLQDNAHKARGSSEYESGLIEENHSHQAPQMVEAVMTTTVATSLLATTRAVRCTCCSRKLSLANTFWCRCGQVFCLGHRWEATKADQRQGHLCAVSHRMPNSP